MAGNTSSSPSGRSLGYIAPVGDDGLTAALTVVNVYVDSNANNAYSPLSGTQPDPVNFEVTPGITSSFKKSYQYVPTTSTASGKYTFDVLSPTTASTTTKYQTVGSPAKLSTDNAVASTAVKYADVVVAAPKFTQKSAVTSGNKNSLPVPAAPQHPGQYQWNLPPHKWSLPRVAMSDPANMPANSKKTLSDDRYRRGRIWWKANDSSVSTVDGFGNTTTASSSWDRKYGFQFLWNPTSFGTGVSVQMDATPNQNDRFLGTVGAFPATENISFNLEINRINDFACANAILKRPSNIGASLGNASSNNFISTADVAKLLPYYQNNGSFTASLIKNGKKKTVEEKLVDLFQRGTLADIEYLYMAINGPGPGGGASGGDHWKNGRGIITADIGFLMPTLLNIDVGPLSYMGYVTSMSVNHTMFTQDMIPIQSTVQISLNLLATAGLATTTTGG
ncbi:hypothetical protein UFOVP115_24 [uncultured Caudovirales phage]|uniref:Uncharacterized protein n=1 Tax=uncultured Caudovirales phage TaxID=2100421 RepID=A0A6J5L7G9_9CAUD|nr:hypothetical protein UFOVP115_24 [uncultured Caudovirales phage]